MAKSNPKVDANGKKLKTKVKRDVAKVLNKNDLVQRNLIAMNPYLESLLDPFNVKGAKIPDSILFPSNPMTIVDRRTLTVNANQVCGISYGVGGATSALSGGSLIPLSNPGTADYAIGMILGTGALTTDLYPAVNGGTYIQLANWSSAASAIPTTFQMVRLVSAGVAIDYTGTGLTSKGKFTLAFAPRNSCRPLLASGAFPLSRVQQIPGSKTCPVNELKGGTVLYKPQDGASMEYVDLDITNVSSLSLISWTGDANDRAATGGELFLIGDGMNVGDSVQITAVFNYEAIPRLNVQSFVQPSPSLSDPIALSHAMNTLQVTPTTFATSAPSKGLSSGNQTLAPNNSAMQVHEVHPGQKSGGNFMDKILGFIDKGSQVVKKIAPLAETVLSMI